VRAMNTADRGYGRPHQRTRAAAFALLPEYSSCARCGLPMWKWERDRRGKSALHWDHTDARDGYLGFSHRLCNMRAGASKGGQVSAAGYGWPRRRAAVWRSPNHW
jgi:hypothetical protein